MWSSSGFGFDGWRHARRWLLGFSRRDGWRTFRLRCGGST
uniref:Uncharacterized protein n=1 Tax=Cucumis melo TaxID=3656 RepID=A0A9I9E3X2_CUCME